MRKDKKCLIKRVVGVLLIVLLLLGLMACGPKAEVHDDTMPPPEALEEEIVEELPPVQISMPEYELTYSGELEDMIVVNELPDEEGCLEFLVKLSEGECRVFVLRFNSDQGEFVTMLDDKHGEKVPVAFEMAELPSGLSDADTELFCTAQDAVNEIVGSLVLK